LCHSLVPVKQYAAFPAIYYRANNIGKQKEGSFVLSQKQ